MKKLLSILFLLSFGLLLIAGLAIAGDTIARQLGLTSGGGAATSAGGITVISSVGQPFSGSGSSPGDAVTLCSGPACDRLGLVWPAYTFRAFLPVTVKGG